MPFSVNERIIERDGNIVGRVESNTICDNEGGIILKIDGDTIKNTMDTLLAKVEKGKIISTSGYELATILFARKSFANANNLPDVEVAAMWLCFVKGMK